MNYNLYGLLVVFTFIVCIDCQYRKVIEFHREARWCVTSLAEKAKCDRLRHAITQRMQTSSDYPSWLKPYELLPELLCVEGSDSFACMEMISTNEADLMQLDPGMGYTAGEYFTMVPLAAEKYDTVQGDDSGLDYYAVAVVRKDNPGFDVETLGQKKACHTGVGRAAGWVYPVSSLIEMEIMGIAECNVPVKSAAAFFGPMCAPNGLARFYNPFGNNPVSVCDNCKGYGDVFCSDHDPYAGYDGAFNCMASKNGDVAFIRDHTIYQMTSNSSGEHRADNITIDLDYSDAYQDYSQPLNFDFSGVDPEEDFELLCPDGGRKPPSEAANCNWGVIPSHIVMTSAIHEEALRKDYTMLLELMSYDFGVEGIHKDIFNMFSSTIFGGRNLMFTDETKMLMNVKDVEKGSRDTYFTWVGEEYRRRKELLNTCPLQQARWCVVSKQEMEKCENMIMAFAAKGLKPDLNCIRGRSTRDCMDKIRLGDADMIALDAADVFVAGKYYGLVPIAAEDYSGYEARTYYAVAVARRTDSHLTVFNLKNRRSCHSAVMTAAGWISPVDKLIETGQIKITDDDVYFNVGQFFSKSCVPGVLNDFYNTEGTNPINLCEACASGPPDRCQRNHEELYFGNSGAFRCLTERGGDVAFVKHTTVRENTDGRNKAEWARNRRSDDYELLCNDGTRRDIDDWESCNMGEIPANAIVTAGFKTEEERQIYWTLLNFAQNFFASDTNNDFSMFASELLDHKDLIFQDSTVRLVSVHPDEQNYVTYLGPRFVRAMERMEGIDTITAASCQPLSSVILVAVTLIFSTLLHL